MVQYRLLTNQDCNFAWNLLDHVNYEMVEKHHVQKKLWLVQMMNNNSVVLVVVQLEECIFVMQEVVVLQMQTLVM